MSMLNKCILILDGFRSALRKDYSETIPDDAIPETLSSSWAEVTYRLKNAPGWLFGIWFSEIPATEGEPAKIRARCFAQLEAFIDKFKPSHSMFSEEFIIRDRDLEEAVHSENFTDYFEYSSVIQMHAFIIDHKFDAAYLDLFQPYNNYYRLPNKFTVWYKVRYKQLKQYLTKRRRTKLVNACKRFIETQLVPAFRDCPFSLYWRYDEHCYPAFDLFVKPDKGQYSLAEINARLDSAWAEYLVAKWNDKHKKDGLVRLYLDYEFIDDDGNTGHAMASGDDTLKDLRDDVVVKKCRWLDKIPLD